jgi:ribosome-binding factor A
LLREVIASDLVVIDDERLAMVAVTRVVVDPEMNRATVYYDSLSGEEGDEEILEAFAEHRRRLQASIGRQVRAKKTPILDFAPDEVIRSAERIDEILRDAATLPQRPPEPESDLDESSPDSGASGVETR